MNHDDRISIWNTYQSAWSAISEAERSNRLEASVAPDCVYNDPQTSCLGLNELAAKIARSQEATPGVSFRNDQLTAYGDQALSEWTMYGRDGELLLHGASYARFGEDGRLIQMSGFFSAPDGPVLPAPTPASTVWDVYQAAWARVSAAQRRSLLAASVAEAVVYSDPAGQKHGLEALADYIAGKQQKAPGVWFEQTAFIEHHGQAISRWERLSPDGEPPIKGASYACIGGDGHLTQMSGFPGSRIKDG